MLIISATVISPDVTYELSSVYRFSPGTSKRPGLNQTKTREDQKSSGPAKTRIAKDRPKTGLCEPVFGSPLKCAQERINLLKTDKDMTETVKNYQKW
jgi:hypothetical protein